jgi:hypothetical protein
MEVWPEPLGNTKCLIADAQHFGAFGSDAPTVPRGKC